MAVTTLVMHGDDNRIVPTADSALLSVKFLAKGALKVYEIATWHAHHTRRGGQRRPSRLHQGLSQLGELSVTLDDIERLRQLDSTCPGPLDLGHRDHHGPWARVWLPAWAWVRRSAEGD
jgi:hypothetical protein